MATEYLLLQLMKRARKSSERYQKRIGELEAQLKLERSCSHSEIRSFEWEHDNGYGVQRKHTGYRCIACGEEDHYGIARWSAPASGGNA